VINKITAILIAFSQLLLFLGAFAKLQNAANSFDMFVCFPSICTSARPSAGENKASTGRLFMKIVI